VGKAADIADLRRLGQRRTPRPVFDYVDGGAGDEIAMRRSIDAFGRVEFLPRVLRDVSAVSTSTTILGVPSALPFAFAPTGFTRMMHAAGECAVARVATRVGIPYTLSTVGTTTPEDLAVASGTGRRWFQLYVWRDRARSHELLERVQASGFDVLVLTVDVPVPGARLRDNRNGLTVPPALTWQTFLSGATHPRWLFDFLTTDPPTFASLESGGSVPLNVLASKMFDPSVRLDDLAWFREIWDGPIVVKGVQTVDDAVALADSGVDAIVLSNHGGRQLDRAATPLELLQPVVERVGDRVEVFMDGGVRNGADIVAAIALGAKAVLVGRAYLYGLMAGGEAGVQRAVDILAADVRRTMQLLGVTSIAELSPALVRLLG
jgi:L-lactate dehydrogenase (cytochrome)